MIKKLGLWLQGRKFESYVQDQQRELQTQG